MRRLTLTPLFFLLGTLFFWNRVAAESATLSITPLAENPQVGDIFSVDIALSAATAPVAGAEFTLTFNDNIVQFRNVTVGDGLEATGRTAVCPPHTNIGTDTVKIACATSGDEAGVAADGTLFTLTFEAVGVGASPLDLSTAHGADDARPPTPLTFAMVDGSVVIEPIPTAVGLSSAETHIPPTIGFLNEMCKMEGKETR